MKRFKTYLVEADQTGAVWENLIAAGWNSTVWTGTTDEKAKAVDAELAKNKKAKGMWNKKDKVGIQINKKHAESIAQATAKELAGGAKALKMTQFGTGSGSTSKFWTSRGATNSTPKTDNYIGDGAYTLSLKKGGSQLASPGGDETGALFAGGIALMDINYPNTLTDSLRSEITATITDPSFQQAFTNQEFSLDTGELNKVVRKIIPALKNPGKKGEPFKGTLAAVRAEIDTLIGDDLENYNTEWAARIRAGGYHEKIEDAIEKVFESEVGSEFKECCIAEAATGWKKFDEGDKGVAEYMLNFEESGTANVGRMIDKSNGKIQSGLKSVVDGVTGFKVGFKRTGTSQSMEDVMMKALKAELGVSSMRGLAADKKKAVKADLGKLEIAIKYIIAGSKDNGIRDLASAAFREVYTNISIKNINAGKKTKYEPSELEAMSVFSKKVKSAAKGARFKEGIPKGDARKNIFPGTEGKTFQEIVMKTLVPAAIKTAGLAPKLAKMLKSTAEGPKGWIAAAAIDAVTPRKSPVAFRIVSAKKAKKKLNAGVEYDTFNQLIENVVTEEAQQFILLEGIWDNIKGFAERAWNWAKETMKKIWNKVLETIDALLKKGTEFLLSFFEMKGTVSW